MNDTANIRRIVSPEDRILITGANGFIGSRVVYSLLDSGFGKLRCLSRSGARMRLPELEASKANAAEVEVFPGNLLSKEDCAAAVSGVSAVIHLAAGRGEKSFPDAYLNSVVTTRNLMEAAARYTTLRRFVNVSSFTVYTNRAPKSLYRDVLDESSPVESRPEKRGEAYCFAKAKQEEIAAAMAKDLGIPYVVVRPGAVYGPGNLALSARVGIGTFGVFLHLGGANPIPLTYVDNCADAIALAGIVAGIDGEVFNIVDDDLPSSRRLLRMYKREVKPFRSLYLPKALSYTLCSLWESYCERSRDQLPPAFNRRRWNAVWRKTRYNNAKLKSQTGWRPRISTEEGLKRYFDACRAELRHA